MGAGGGGRNRVELDPDAMYDQLSALTRDPSREELLIKENYGREGAEQIEELARSFQLYFKTYGKGTNTVLVASKVPLPNYRADLDNRRRAEHEVAMSERTQDIVSRALNNTNADNAFGFAAAAAAAAHPKRPRPDAAAPANKPLTRDAELSASIAASEARRREDPKVAEMERFREKLPAFHQRDELLQSIARSQVLVVSGETGCGKTTQLPQFVLEKELLEGNGSATSIICTQPRRISAISVAERVAQERAEALGGTVGYQIRLEKRASEDTRLLFCTTGILLRRMQLDPDLNGVSHIVRRAAVCASCPCGAILHCVGASCQCWVILRNARARRRLWTKFMNARWIRTSCWSF